MKQQGFSLLEAIVALVIVAGVGVSLFSWINTNLISLNRVQAAQQRNEAIQNALSFISIINPMATPQGNETLGIYTFEWQAELIEPVKRGKHNIGGPGYYELGLYDVEIIVQEEEDEVARFNVRQTGYTQVRKPDFSGGR